MPGRRRDLSKGNEQQDQRENQARGNVYRKHSLHNSSFAWSCERTWRPFASSRLVRSSSALLDLRVLASRYTPATKLGRENRTRSRSTILSPNRRRTTRTYGKRTTRMAFQVLERGQDFPFRESLPSFVSFLRSFASPLAIPRSRPRLTLSRAFFSTPHHRSALPDLPPILRPSTADRRPATASPGLLYLILFLPSLPLRVSLRRGSDMPTKTYDTDNEAAYIILRVVSNRTCRYLHETIVPLITIVSDAIILPTNRVSRCAKKSLRKKKERAASSRLELLSFTRIDRVRTARVKKHSALLRVALSSHPSPFRSARFSPLFRLPREFERPRTTTTYERRISRVVRLPHPLDPRTQERVLSRVCRHRRVTRYQKVSRNAMGTTLSDCKPCAMIHDDELCVKDQRLLTAYILRTRLFFVLDYTYAATRPTNYVRTNNGRVTNE